jgi:hypothetical protein
MKQTKLWSLTMLIMCMLGLSLPPSAFAQSKVTGKVLEKGKEALPGVSILIKGTQKGTTTDANGVAQFEFPILKNNHPYKDVFRKEHLFHINSWTTWSRKYFYS